MQRHEDPPQGYDPYPECGTPIVEVRYETTLALVPLKNAPKSRDGKDAAYVVARPFKINWHCGKEDWRQITVPQGFITDLTSVPWGLHWFVDRFGPWLGAAIVHDYLYAAWEEIPNGQAHRSHRRFADDLMFAAMVEAQVFRPVARGIHMAVTLFGGPSFKGSVATRYASLEGVDVTEQFDFTSPRIT